MAFTSDHTQWYGGPDQGYADLNGRMNLSTYNDLLCSDAVYEQCYSYEHDSKSTPTPMPTPAQPLIHTSASGHVDQGLILRPNPNLRPMTQLVLCNNSGSGIVGRSANNRTLVSHNSSSKSALVACDRSGSPIGDATGGQNGLDTTDNSSVVSSKFRFFSQAGKEKSKTSKINEESESKEQSDKVKTKLMSMWNNVKYGWTVKLKTNFSRESAIWFLGQCYHKGPENVKEETTSSELSAELESFRQDFCSRIWFTYRREFPTLAGSSLSTDCGWGCMLRSGQMMLAQALVHNFLGRGWRWSNQQVPWQDDMHRQIIHWFLDAPSSKNPFSIHNLITIGETSGKKAGDWYGPASVAHILKQAMENAAKYFSKLEQMCVYVAQDCTVYKQDVLDMCLLEEAQAASVQTGEYDSSCSSYLELWRKVVIFIPVRLGGETLNPVYIDCIKSLFHRRDCIGIIGGRPRHSLFFAGYQDEKLIHMDPHYCQEVASHDLKNLQSFHCMSPRKMPFSRMDPSCTIGFFCESREEFERFIVLSKEVALPQPCPGEYPIFVVSDGRAADCNIQSHRSSVDFRHDSQMWRARNTSIASSEAESEDFVVL